VLARTHKVIRHQVEHAGCVQSKRPGRGLDTSRLRPIEQGRSSEWFQDSIQSLSAFPLVAEEPPVPCINQAGARVDEMLAVVEDE
jgi:hypothetical protein